MYTLNGFVIVDAFVSNAIGVVSPIGQLSTRSQTYSLTVGQYDDPTNYPEFTLMSFLSAEDTGPAPVPNAIVEQVLKFSQWLYARTIAASASSDTDQILSDILAAFQTEASAFQAGASVTTTDGRFYLPEWLSWTNNAYEGGVNTIKIFFADQTFQNEFAGFSVIPVYPFLPIDNFFLAPATVAAALTSRSNAQLSLDIEAAKNGNPETVQWGNTYNYIAPGSGIATPANFNALIYGAAGNNPDSITDSICTAILAASTHTRAEWVAILPDLFKRTEVILTPVWNSYAIPDQAQITGIYSPIANLSTALAIAIQTAVGYPAYHVNAYTEVMTEVYKSISVISTGGPENRNNQFQLSDFFPDYIAVGSGSTDYSRMSKTTTDWLYLLATMLPIAETMTLYSPIPLGMSRITRGGIMYLVATYQSTQYLVVAKWNFLNPQDTVVPPVVVETPAASS